MSAQLDYRSIRKRAEELLVRDKRMMRLIFLIINLVIYIAFMIIGWSLFLNNGGQAPTTGVHVGFNEEDPFTAAMVLLSTVGGIGVLFQFISLIIETKAGERQMRERAMGRALNEEMMRLADETGEPQEKAKHMMQLSDDGELEAIVDEESDAEAEALIRQQARRQR